MPTDPISDPTEAVPARRGIQSVTTGFRVLAALAAEPESATLSVIAARAKLSASQAHRYLASLIASGMAHQDAASGRYNLGPQAIQIGLAALARTDVFAEADPAVADFVRKTGRTTLIAALGPLGPTIVRWHAGRVPVSTSLSVGSVLPLLGSATGHVFLSFMSDDEAAGAIAHHVAAAVDRRPRDVAAMHKDVAAIRKQVRAAMSASVDELLIPGLRAAAVPILDIQNRAALVVTVMATPAFARRDDMAVTEALKSTCKQLTERVGGAWQKPLIAKRK
ncbi:MAG: IclR family transcriptional regulator [Proteobacteria bacterium]|nr:IclR family transcriptional regulator [Pseudomonadota bacterium]